MVSQLMDSNPTSWQSSRLLSIDESPVACRGEEITCQVTLRLYSLLGAQWDSHADQAADLDFYFAHFEILVVPNGIRKANSFITVFAKPWKALFAVRMNHPKFGFRICHLVGKQVDKAMKERKVWDSEGAGERKVFERTGTIGQSGALCALQSNMYRLPR